MNITINSQVLGQEVRLLSKIAASKPTIPILGHILLHAEDGLRLSATDLEIAMTSECQAIVSEMGEMTLPAKALLDILDRIPDADVEISEKGISSGSFKSKLASLRIDDFPTLPVPDGGQERIPVQALRSIIERTSYAISDKEQKFVMRGALLSLKDDGMAMVATDGRRLSVATAKRGTVPDAAGPDATAIIPSKTLDSIMDQTPIGEVAFTRGDRHLFFNFGRRLLISRMIDGEFPKYQRVIPKANGHTATIDRAALAAAIRRVGLAAEIMAASFSSGSLGLHARSAEVGEAAESLPARYEGPEIRVCFNWDHVLDFLEHASDPAASFALKDDTTPILLKDGQDFLNVVMVVKG